MNLFQKQVKIKVRANLFLFKQNAMGNYRSGNIYKEYHSVGCDALQHSLTSQRTSLKNRTLAYIGECVYKKMILKLITR